MARLNDPPQPGQESFEAVKKRYIRQNREIARVNSTQSTRIRSLETETTRLLTENIDLREQVIKLQASLDRRERSKAVAENVEATKKQLEGKVAEMQELLANLGKALSLSPKAKPQPKQKAYILSSEQRTWKRGLSFSEVMGTEDNLPAISEDSRRSSLNADEPRRTSLGNESRRSSLNFEEITLLPPRADDAESDEDLKPPASSMLDVRPRRRRDSSRPVDLEISRALPKTQSTADSSERPEKPKKRRYEDRGQVQDIEPPLDLEFKFTKLSQSTIDMTKQQAESQKSVVSVVTLDEPEYDTEPMNEDEMDEIEKIVEAGKRAVKMDLIEKRDPIPPKETVTSSATSTVGRRALGPKSTNSDPSNSPLKQAAIKAALPKERGFEKPDKAELPPPKMKPYRESDIKEIPPLDVEPAAGTGRPSRRTKTNNVNYALPNLRDKMRRHDNPSEAVKSERRASRRSTTGGRLKNKDSSEEFVLKNEEFNDEGVIFESQWLEPTLPHARTLAVDAVEESRKTRETGIGGLLEKRSSREKGGELELPATVMTHRKKRSSNLHKLMDLENDVTTERSAPFESGQKTVSFDPESTHGGGSQSRDRTESTNARRNNLIHSHLLPLSSHVDVVGETSMALNEAMRSSQRATLGGMASRRRSMML